MTVNLNVSKQICVLLWNFVPESGRRPKLEFNGSLLKFSQHRAEVNLDRNKSWSCSLSNIWNAIQSTSYNNNTIKYNCNTHVGVRQLNSISGFQAIFGGRHDWYCWLLMDPFKSAICRHRWTLLQTESSLMLFYGLRSIYLWKKTINNTDDLNVKMKTTRCKRYGSRKAPTNNF